MKSCRYCKGKYAPSPVQTMGAGCSFQCKLDIKNQKESEKGGAEKPPKFSSFNTSNRKPLVAKKPLSSKSTLKSKTQLKSSSTLKSKSQLKSSSKLRSLGMSSSAAKELKLIKKQKAKEKKRITPHLENKPDINIDALALAAKTTFHRYIRERDYGKPCPCCNQPLGEDYHAGHFMESGSNSSIRYNEFNVHGQRADCNIAYNGDRGDYEKNLRLIIGDEKVDWLLEEAARKAVTTYTAQDYIEIKNTYDRKLKDLFNLSAVASKI